MPRRTPFPILEGPRTFGPRLSGPRFCWPGQAVLEHTLVGEPLFAAWRMTAAQHAVLVALCRPYADGGSPWSTPATNHEIAEHLSLSVDAVKTHL